MAGASKVGGFLSVLNQLREAVNRWICSRGYVPFDIRGHYGEDGLFTVHNDEFVRDPRFRAAYERGVRAGHGVDPHIRWRLHIALWAAGTALRTEGDFVECGVNAGMISSAVLQYLDWARQEPRKYFLIDTFAGPDLSQFSQEEHQSGWVKLVEQQVASGGYVTDMERVHANFAEWPNAVIVQGRVPEILSAVPAQRVAFLHLDLNCAAPEAAAIEHFWPRIPVGGAVLLDDYAHNGVGAQKHAIDAWAARSGASILSLPTGQGLILRW